MLDAKQAREKALRAMVESQAKEFIKLEKGIRQAADAGETRCSYPGTLSPGAREQLEDMGYLVTVRRCGPNEIETVVKW